MSVSDELAADVLAKCGRCCCLCRRFKPIQLQVHHIVPPSDGGQDELDNLIALCLTCHTDVHTKAPFTRRFTVEELKMHRDKVYRLVAEGRLPSGDTAVDFLGMVPDSIDQGFSELTLERSIASLAPAAIKVLTAAASANGHVIMVLRSVQAGGKDLVEKGDDRSYAEYRQAVQQLESYGLLEDRKGLGEVFFVTHDGYLLADELIAEGGQAEQ